MITCCACMPPAPQIVRWQADIERLQAELQELAGEAYMVDEAALAGVKAEDCIFKVGVGWAIVFPARGHAHSHGYEPEQLVQDIEGHVHRQHLYTIVTWYPAAVHTILPCPVCLPCLPPCAGLCL
jgi:hypothetical protein